MSQQATLEGQPPGISTAELPETSDPEVNPGAIIKKSTESQLLPVNANDTTDSSKDKVLPDPSRQPPKCNTNASAKADLPTDAPSEVPGGTLQASQGQASSSGGLHQETCPPSGPVSAKPNHHWKKPKRPRKKLTIARSAH